VSRTAASPTRAAPGLVAITWPLFAELLLGTLVGLAGLALAARVSDSASGAYAMANHVQQAFYLLFRIVSMGVSVVITQQLGAGDRAGADASARAALGASSWLGLGVALAVAAGSGGLLRLLNAPAEVLVLARPFLQWLAIGLALDAYNASMASVMRAHLRARDTLFVMLAMHGLHLALCVPLMDGFGALPAMGLPGFAIALAASRALGLALHLWLWRRRLSLRPARRDWWLIRRARLAPVLHIGLPGAAENIAWRLAMMVTVALVAGMGVSQLAAQAYTLQIQHFVMLFGVAVGFASEILVGHLVGAGRLHDADRLVHKSMRWGLAVGTVGALAAALAAPWTLALFTRDPNVVAWGSTLLWIAVLLEPGRVFNLVVINALRATGDARFPVAAGSMSMLVVMAGGSWLLGVHFGLGLPGVWIAYTADEWLRGLLMAARWQRRGWLGHARATHRHVNRARRIIGQHK
jgi:putative MATE family efflux protein